MLICKLFNPILLVIYHYNITNFGRFDGFSFLIQDFGSEMNVLYKSQLNIADPSSYIYYIFAICYHFI